MPPPAVTRSRAACFRDSFTGAFVAGPGAYAQGLTLGDLVANYEASTKKKGKKKKKTATSPPGSSDAHTRLPLQPAPSARAQPHGQV